MSAHRHRRTTSGWPGWPAWPGRLGRLLLGAGALLGVVSAVTVVGCLLVGIRPMVVVSGSMGPAVPAGSLAFAQETPAGAVRAGDVVTVLRADGSRVMHRVVSVRPAGDRVALTLKGDANATPDPESYVVDSVGTVRAHVPGIGHPVAWLSSPWGLLALGAVGAGLVVFALRPGGRSGGRDTGGAGGGVAGGLAATVVAVAAVTTTGAWFTDAGAVTAGPVQAHLVVSQAQPTCTNVDGVLVLGNIARLTWAQVDARYQYAWEVRRSDTNALVTSGTVGTGLAQGATVTLDLGTGLLGIDTNYDVVVRARLAGTTTWAAATATTTPVRRASILIIGAAVRCGHA